MMKTGSPLLFRWLSPRYLLCEVPGALNSIYLTFDDGPIPAVTPGIIDILSHYGAKATFFMVGDNVKKHPAVYNEVVGAGHATGNHTFHHLNGWRTPPGAYAEDVYRCREYFHTGLFRPPYGKFTPSQYFLLKNDYRFILWSVLSYDFHPAVSREQCLANVTGNIKPGSIVVFHDNLKSEEKVRYVLPLFLEHCMKMGYRFETLSQSFPESEKL